MQTMWQWLNVTYCLLLITVSADKTLAICLWTI